MTDRLTVETITSDQLAALYDRLAKAERAANLLADSHRHAEQADAVTAETKRLMERRTTTLRERAERAEATIERVRQALRTTFMAGPDAVSVVRADAIRAALDEPRAVAGQRLNEEQAAAVQAADLAPGTRVTRAVVDEALAKPQEPSLVDQDGEPICTCTYGERCPNCPNCRD